jgi:hypothetical protein
MVILYLFHQYFIRICSNIHIIKCCFVSRCTKLLYMPCVPSNLVISSGGINFVTPMANFWLHLLGSFHEISKNFKNKLPSKNFSHLILFYAKKWFIVSFLKIFILLEFVTELILKSQRNLPENINKEAV